MEAPPLLVDPLSEEQRKYLESIGYRAKENPQLSKYRHIAKLTKEQEIQKQKRQAENLQKVMAERQQKIEN